MSAVIAFRAADHKDGSTALARCAAEKLAEMHPEKKVILLQCCEKSCSLEDAQLSIDDIVRYIKNCSADFDELAEKCLKMPGAGILAGYAEPGLCEMFDPKDGRFLASGLSLKADYLVCDCGSSIENGLALGVLGAADIICQAVTPCEASLKRCEMLRPVCERLGIGPDIMIVNKLSRRSFYSEKEAAKRAAQAEENLLSFHLSAFGDLADAEHRSLCAYREKSSLKDSEALAAVIEAMLKERGAI